MTSIFELFKIGIGPSSSHTVGPMRAARQFAQGLNSSGLLAKTARVRTDLFGSLALTGKGHGTDRAILLGLSGEVPDQVDPSSIDAKLEEIHGKKAFLLFGTHSVKFDPQTDLVFRKTEVLPGHSNGMRFTAYNDAGEEIATRIFYSVGGGFVLAEGEKIKEEPNAKPIPYRFKSAAELLELGQQNCKAIWEMVLENERTLRNEADIIQGISSIWQAMK